MEQQPEKKAITTPEEIDRALCSLAVEVLKLDRRTVELAEVYKAHTTTITAMADAQERILKHHGVAFQRIAELLVGLGCDIAGPEISELRALFNKPSPPEV